MLEQILVIAIVAVAAVWLGRHALRRLRGKGCNCGTASCEQSQDTSGIEV